MCKYPFKYVTKGFYCTRLKMESNVGSSSSSLQTVNEIDNHQECCYITSNEVVWRLSKYDIHHTCPSIQRFDVILAGMNINSMSRFPIRYVPKKSFSVGNSQMLPSTKVRQFLFIQRLYFSS